MLLLISVILVLSDDSLRGKSYRSRRFFRPHVTNPQPRLPHCFSYTFNRVQSQQFLHVVGLNGSQASTRTGDEDEEETESQELLTSGKIRC